MTETKPKIITIGGLTGVGKTTLADSLAEHMNKNGQKAIAIDSDRLRKELWGVPETTPLPAEAYDWSITEQVIAKAREITEDHLKQGYAVVQSAAHVTQKSRHRQKQYADSIGAEHIGIFLTCPKDELETRIQKRREAKNSASDAGPDILKRFMRAYDGQMSWKKINADRPVEDVLKASIAVIGSNTFSTQIKRKKQAGVQYRR